MKYTKKVIIEQIMHKYKLTEEQAKNMLESFELTDDVDILCGVIFNDKETISISIITAFN